MPVELPHRQMIHQENKLGYVGLVVRPNKSDDDSNESRVMGIVVLTKRNGTGVSEKPNKWAIFLNGLPNPSRVSDSGIPSFDAYRLEKQSFSF